MASNAENASIWWRHHDKPYPDPNFDNGLPKVTLVLFVQFLDELSTIVVIWFAEKSVIL